MKKRLVSLLLAVLMIITGALTVFAQDATEEFPSEETAAETVKGEIFTFYDQEHYKLYDVVVICFDSKYTSKGEMPSVTLDVYTDGAAKEDFYKRVYISENSVTQELFTYENVNYPQIFIKIPLDFNFKDARTFIKIQEGAFLTEDGEKSCEVELPYISCIEDSKRDRVKLTCKGDAVTKADSKPITVLQDSTVSAQVEFNSEYADVWMANSEINFYYLDSVVETTENTVTAENEGRYTVEFKINDQVKIKKYFQSVSKNKRYFENLGDRTEALLLTPIALVVSLLLLLVPGFGTWIGGTSLLSCIYAVPGFFTALFGKYLSIEYYF